MSLTEDFKDMPQASAGIKSPFATNSDVFDMGWGNKAKDGPSAKGSEQLSWRILSDWTPCSVTCGGGTMTMQRQC